MVKTLWLCEHCRSFYEIKSRAIRCAKKDLGDLRIKGNYKPIITKYVGNIKREKSNGTN
jgi:hypothetical protein